MGRCKLEFLRHSISSSGIEWREIEGFRGVNEDEFPSSVAPIKMCHTGAEGDTKAGHLRVAFFSISLSALHRGAILASHQWPFRSENRRPAAATWRNFLRPQTCRLPVKPLRHDGRIDRPPTNPQRKKVWRRGGRSSRLPQSGDNSLALAQPSD